MANKVKKDKKIYFDIIVEILFLFRCILAIIFCILKFTIDEFIIAISFGLLSILYLVFIILSLNDFYRKSYFISYKHEYYLGNINLFENLILKKKKKVFIINKYIKTKLFENYKYIYFNDKLNIKLVVYELKNNYQLIKILNSELQKNEIMFCYDDIETNTKLLINNFGISNFTEELGIKHFYSNDKRNLITIIQFENKFYIHEYHYSITYSNKIKSTLMFMKPHWHENKDGLLYSFNSIEDAKNYAIEEINRINDYYSLDGTSSLKTHYFILVKDSVGTLYHEFQTGNRKDVNWDKTSILLSEDIMEKSNISKLFEKVIPNYDYYGISLVTKESWEILKIESLKESSIVQNIIQEMTPWADKSIDNYNCFTIHGI